MIPFDTRAQMSVTPLMTTDLPTKHLLMTGVGANFGMEHLFRVYIQRKKKRIVIRETMLWVWYSIYIEMLPLLHQEILPLAWGAAISNRP